jgi:predicted RNA-binding protein with RPS1 domain
MSRLIQDMIRKALADELLFGRLVNGGRVTVDMDENEKIRLELWKAMQHRRHRRRKQSRSNNHFRALKPELRFGLFYLWQERRRKIKNPDT